MTKFRLSLCALLMSATAFCQSAEHAESAEKDLLTEYALLSSYEWLFDTNNKAHCKVVDKKEAENPLAEKQLNISAVNVFPNPVNTCRLNIEFEAIDDSDVHVKISDMSGKELHSSTIPGKKGKMQHQLNMESYNDSFVIVTLYQRDMLVSKRVLLTK